MESSNKEEPLPLKSLNSHPTKRYATFQTYDSDIYKHTNIKRQSVFTASSKSPQPRHYRTASAPSTMLHLQDLDTEIETDKYEDYIVEHCPQLIPNCDCKSCHPPPILSPPTSTYNIPFSSIKYASSVPQFSTPSTPSPSKSSITSTSMSPTFTDNRYSVAASCEKTKNLSLIRTIGMGIKNNMPRLLSILNDVNGRLLFQQYQNRNDFYKVNDTNIVEEHNYNDDDEDDEDDDDDVDIIDSVHAAFAEFSRLNSLSPITASQSCFLLDCVPLLSYLSSRSIVRLNNKSWNILNRMPIHQALRTYQERIAKPLTFSPKYLINDSIAHYIGQISLITVVVQKLVREQSMPLQLDCVILSKQAIENMDCNDIQTIHDQQKLQNKQNKHDNHGGYDHDYDDEEKGEKDELIKPCSANKLSQHKYHHYSDDIGDNLMDRFLALPNKHSDHYSHFAVGVPPRGSARKKLGPKLEKRVKLLNKTQHGRYVVIIDRKGQRTNALYKETWKKQKDEKNDKPCLLKRKTTTKILQLEDDHEDIKKSEVVTDEKEDFFYFFQPPAPYGDIIEGIAMCESMHMNTLDFLLPALKSEDCPIGARHLCGGKMFCISFHMMSKDEVKCYLYLDQKCMKIELNRGKPITDLMRILPHYFDDDTFEELNIIKQLKNKKLKVSEIKQFKQCIDKYRFNHQDIENDIGLEYKKSKIVKCLQAMPYVWKETRIETVYSSLRTLFGLPPLLEKQTTYDHNMVENTSQFSTVDTKYNEMVKKLGIEKNYKSPLEN